MSNEGWIKIHRKILKWGWYDDADTFRVFMHLLLTANHEEKEWHGMKVKIGQTVIGRKKLAKELKITEQRVRTSLLRLKSTNEITIKPTTQFSLVEINKWKSYQIINQPNNQQLTNDQPTINHTLRNKELKNERNLPKGKERSSKEPLPESMNQDIDRSFPRKRLYGDETLNWFLDYWDYKFPNGFVEGEKWARIYVGHFKKKIGAGKLREMVEWVSDPDCWWYSRLSGFKMLYYKRDMILKQMEEPKKSNILKLD